MQTKISRFADGIMEAAWLAAIIVVPVFFNIYSSRIFEPDKITLLRTLALVIIAAWLIKLIEQGGFRWEKIDPADSKVKALLSIPMVLPVLALAAVYLLSTILSISPRVSLLGSYQRLQGTYTLFSYLVVFASIAANLRRREQVERLLSVAIIASLPVSLYGILQRYRADPIPWGGDVTGRIAANMGNSIFVAAFLIMVFPLALMRMIDAFEALIMDRGRLGPNFARATGYVFIVALQSIALYFSQSRGPWLGWGASLVLIVLGLSLIWRARWLTISGVILALVTAGFLLLLNIPNGPLESVRARPEFNRLGQLLDAESRTGKVRSLIWQGAADLVRPHDPIEFPDGRKDSLNAIRPLIGYGPESMYVAYNRFYPPELTQVEKRNASPDRSHNETWDSLVVTGILGLIIYLTLFGSVLYYGLKWLGMIHSSSQRNLFFLLIVFGGAITGIFFWIWKGIGYVGVALPFGMVIGIILYLIWSSLFGHVEISTTSEEKQRAYVLIGLVAGIVAHFVEINFGIAIAATRTYFWFYSALILLVGYVLPLWDEYRSPVKVDDQELLPNAESNTLSKVMTTSKASQVPGRERRSGSSAKKKRYPSKPGTKSWEVTGISWLRQGLIIGFIIAIFLTILGYEYISNINRANSAINLISISFTTVGGSQQRLSFGIFALIFTTWLIGVIILASEWMQRGDDDSPPGVSSWLKMIATALGLSFFLALLFWFWNAQNLISLSRVTATTMNQILDQVKESENLITAFYIYLFLLIFGLSILLPKIWPSQTVRWPVFSQVYSIVLLLLAFITASITNLRIVQADISFKTADLFANPNGWPVAISIYNRAKELAPNEDYYYLFLGRAYLEYGRTIEDEVERESLITQAANDLFDALKINPLNTDHTANIARLHSLWTQYTQDPVRKEELAKISDEYFSKATMLSPNNARLFDEWAVLLLNTTNKPEEARDLLLKSLEIDPYYDWTYALLGDYYSRFQSRENGEQSEQEKEALIKASEFYSTAIRLIDPGNTSFLYNYWIALANVSNQLGDIQKTIQAYENASNINPNSGDQWRIQAVLAQLLAQGGQNSRALDHAQKALTLAPDDQKATLQDLVLQLGGQP